MFQRRDIILAAIIVILTTVTYAPSLLNDFVNWDDGKLVYHNPIVTDFSLQSVKKAFSSYDPELYVPLTMVTFQLEHLFFGANPFVFHLTGLLLHIANALLIFAIFSVLSKKKILAFSIALLFAVHPLNTETAAWVSARKDVLSAFFFLAAYFAYLQSKNKSSISFYLLALLSKVTVVVYPLVLLLTDWRQNGRLTKQDVASKWPYFFLSIVFGVIAVFGKVSNVTSLSVFETLLLAAKSTVFYLQKIFAPLHLTVFYEFNGSVTLFSSDFLPSVVAALIITCVSIWSLKRTREVFFGVAFFALLVAPSFATFSKAGFLFFASDRYAYLAMPGILYGVLWMLFHLRKENILLICISVSALVLAILSYNRSLVWSDTQTLYEAGVEAYPDSFIAQHNLGVMYLDQQRYEEAIPFIERAIAINPNHAKAYANMGFALGRLGRYEEGLPYALKALELDPEKQDEYRESLELIEAAQQ